MRDLAVVTLTNNTRTQWLEQCVESVKRFLPDSAQHYVVRCSTMAEYAGVRLEALRLARYVAFVDDDDVVINDSLNLCLNAVKSETCAVAFCDEEVIDENRKAISHLPVRKGLKYGDIISSVRTIHHLAVVETSAVISDMKKLLDELSCHSCVDWLVCGTAALQGGAVHVPVKGYQWRMHKSNMHKLDNHSFGAASKAARTVMAPMVGKNN